MTENYLKLIRGIVNHNNKPIEFARLEFLSQRRFITKALNQINVPNRLENWKGWVTGEKKFRRCLQNIKVFSFGIQFEHYKEEGAF